LFKLGEVEVILAGAHYGREYVFNLLFLELSVATWGVVGDDREALIAKAVDSIAVKG
jgi:hypothetical protein